MTADDLPGMQIDSVIRAVEQEIAVAGFSTEAQRIELYKLRQYREQVENTINRLRNRDCRC